MAVAMVRTCAASLAIFLLGAALFAPRADAAPITLSASSTFDPGGNSSLDTFSISNLSDPGVEISQVVITLASGLLFDVTGASPGTGGFAPLTLGAVPGGTATSPGLSDGDTVLTINFTGFDPGEGFTFTVDVDRTSQDNVNANQFSGSTIQVTFMGSFVGSPLSFSQSFVQSGNISVASVNQPAEMLPTDPPAAVPEPASLALWTLLGIGGVGCGLRRWRKRRRVDG